MPSVKVTEKQARHLRHFEDALAPDPREWQLTGVREWEPPAATSMRGNDQPSCVCGQAIRTAYVLRRDRDGAEVTVGSTCIQTSVPFLMAHGAGAVARTLQSAVAEHRRQLERSKAAELAGPLIEDHQKLIGWLETAARAIRDRWPGPRYEDRWIYHPHAPGRRLPNARMRAAIEAHGPLPFIARYDAWPDFPASGTRSGVRSSRKRIAAAWLLMWTGQSGIPADLPDFPLPAADQDLREQLTALAQQRQGTERPYAAQTTAPASAAMIAKLDRLLGALAAGDDTVKPWSEPNPDLI